MRVRKMAALLVFMLASSTLALAQEATGAIQGRVVDAQNLEVAGASVTATGPLGSTNTTTDTSGRFTVPSLRPGSYVVRVTLQGFKTVEQQNVTVSLGQVAAVNVRLEVGSISEQVVVTGADRSGYRQEDATAGTKLPVPIRDVPQSIQVVPRQVIEDQGAVRIQEVVQNVSSVYRSNANFGDVFAFRGFQAGGSSGSLRDGLPERRESRRDEAGIERIEVLKGPGSVLYGRLQPGGAINYVTKQPLFTHGIGVELKANSFGMWRPTFDLNTVALDRKLGLRVTGAVEQGGDFVDFSFSDRTSIGTTVALQPSQNTKVSLELELFEDRRMFDQGIPVQGAGPAPLPVTLFLGEPSDYLKTSDRLYGYAIEQTLGPAWKLRHVTRAYSALIEDARTTMRFLDPVTGDLPRDFNSNRRDRTQLTTQLELTGDVHLIGMRHLLLVGTDYDYAGNDSKFYGSAPRLPSAPTINVFNPVYGQFSTRSLPTTTDADEFIKGYGLYVQDLIELRPSWKLLLGGRFDAAKNSSENRLRTPRVTVQADDRDFSPRAGLVWQPARVLSLYTSYSQSFSPVLGADVSGRLFQPETGKQYEAGAKTEWFGGRLAATTAVYQIQKQNIRVPDPANAGFSIQTGEVTSDGLEFDVSGSPVPGLNLIGNVAFTRARISRDTRANLRGNRPQNVPPAGAGLWASYEPPSRGWWQGLGGGLGVYYVGDKAGSDANTFFLPSYTRWDTGIWYGQKQWRLSLKVNNLFDTRYFENSNSGSFSFRCYPGAPRHVLASLSYRM